MKGWRAFGVLALVVCGWTAGIWAQQQQSDLSKPKAPLVSVVGCASRTADGTWMLTTATDGIESQVLFLSAKEIEEAKTKALGNNRYTLLGTPEFLTKEELLKYGQRAEFTRPEVANATGQLQDGRTLIVKGLLITAPNEQRLNLVAVQQLGDTCPQPASSPTASASLDYEFFKTKVQPVFLTKRPGHARCIACHHAGRAQVPLQPLLPGSTTWNEEQSRKNFETVQRVVVPDNLKSMLLIHPLAEEAGGDFYHSGGKHWNSQNDPEWQILKAWVLGQIVK